MTGDDGDNANKPTGYRFGEFRLYPAARLLLRGEEKVRIRSMSFSLLRYLVENSGREIEKGELRQGVWQRDALEDSTIASHMTSVREAVGPEFFDTITGVGYQFIGTVEPLFGPPPRVIAAVPPTTLPPRPVSAEGRAAELAEAEDLGASSRLLTIVGPAGIGKSWLASELAWRMLGNFPDGAHWIDLAPVKEASAVASATAKALGVVLRGTVSPIDAIAVWLGKRPNKLLIFDGCEYVAGAAATMIDALRARAPQVTILATSQENLHIGAETVFRLEPMTPEAAATLFVERIRAAVPAFALEDEDAVVVAEICRRLDFMPLALVLAASLVPALGLAAVRAGLDERFRMLTTGLRAAPDRQQTLLAAVEWSHGLLDPADQLLFRRLARFSGSFSAEALIAVAGTDGAAKWEINLSLRRLVEKSLLVADGGKPPRYRLLETLQAYALERLQESGESDTIAERHARYFQALFDPADEVWETVPDAEWLKPRAPEIDNIRAALDWALALPERALLGIALFAVGGRLWYMLDLAPEGRQYGEKFVALLDDKTPPAMAARLLRYLGLLWREADRQRAVTLLERSAALYRQIGDRPNLGTVLGLLGGSYFFLGRYDEAKATLDEAWAILSGSSRLKSQFSVSEGLGLLAVGRNEADEAREHFVAALDLARKVKDVLRENNALLNLGDVEFRRGAADPAIDFAQQAANGFRAAGQNSYLARALTNLGEYQALSGDSAGARTSAGEALSLLAGEGGHWLRLDLQTCALIAAQDGRYAEAAQLQGYVEADYARTGEHREPTEQKVCDAVMAVLAAHLAAESIQAFAAEGAKWSEARAADFTLSRIIVPENPAG